MLDSETPDKGKKPLYKRWWFIGLAAFIGLGVMGSVFGEEPADEPVITAADTTADAAADTTLLATTTTILTQATTSSTVPPTSSTTSTVAATTTAASTTTTERPGTTTTAPTTQPPTTTTAPQFASFPDGTWVVGTDIEPGTYRNTDSLNLCFWERLAGFGGGLDDTIANGLSTTIEIVTIDSTDAGFSSQDCGEWTTDLTPRTSSPDADFGDGVWLVGTEVAPGLWRNDDSSGLCFWERLSGFGGALGDTIANGLSENIETVEISATDVGFASQDCGTWAKIG